MDKSIDKLMVSSTDLKESKKRDQDDSTIKPLPKKQNLMTSAITKQ